MASQVSRSPTAPVVGVTLMATISGLVLVTVALAVPDTTPPSASLAVAVQVMAACRKYCNTPFETQLMVSQYASEVMLEDYVEATKGPNGEPGVVIVHVEAAVHLHRSLARIRALGGSPRRAAAARSSPTPSPDS